MDSSSKAQRKASGYPDAVLTIVLFHYSIRKKRVMVPCTQHLYKIMHLFFLPDFVRGRGLRTAL